MSYDDADIIHAEIDFANNLGLGGVLIWSIDQETAVRDALKAVVGDIGLDEVESEADNAACWQEATAQDCVVTECGGSCDAGYISITTQPCGSATPTPSLE